MNEKLLKIISFYGVIPQLKYFQSEVFELNEAILEYEHFYLHTSKAMTYYNMSTEHIAEEIADVMVMLNQFMLYYKISEEEVKNIMIRKIDRQLGRIENENNN